MKRILLAALASALLVAGLPSAAQAHRVDSAELAGSASSKPAPAVARPRPVIFVHGFSGSGSQYETQARRFASNGYPADIIEAHEYDSTFTVNTVADVYAGLDARVSRLLAQTRADKVDLLGHSLGTALMQGYLNSSPERAARVAHYVNLDGATAAAPPGGVPTLAIWGEGNPARAIVGATNLYLSDQAHTQTVTSAESFRAVYQFFTGREPRTTAILPERTVQLSGRAVLFPSNVGVSGARLEVYEVSLFTGHRRSHRPVAVFTLGGDGAFGPFRARPLARYEFAIVRPGAPTHHLYYQAFRRTDRLIRLLTSVPGTGLGALVEASDTTTAVVVNRNKEWWGDADTLRLNGTSVLNTANAPRTKRVIGIFAYDAHLDGLTDLSAPIPAFFSQPFITGIDVYLPAAPNGARTMSAVALPRGGGIDVINVPNWPSTGHRITLQFNDYT